MNAEMRCMNDAWMMHEWCMMMHDDDNDNDNDNDIVTVSI